MTPSPSNPNAAHPDPLRGISSMATRLLLAELLADWQAQGGAAAAMESVGGVDAARRVQAGEAFDVVILAADAMAKLDAAGCLVPGSRVDLVLSGTSVAVPAGADLPDISNEAAVRAAVLAAPTLSYSTGPSGVALARMFERWGIAEQIKDRILTPQPGTPVAQLLAQGQVSLGFQQLSELIHAPGIAIVGPMPADIAIDTVFTGAVRQGSARLDDARALLAFMASPQADAAKRRQGMNPV
jgi:molybdate transport system substrate-binding protein